MTDLHADALTEKRRISALLVDRARQIGTEFDYVGDYDTAELAQIVLALDAIARDDA